MAAAATTIGTPLEDAKLCYKCVKSIFLECGKCKAWVDYQKQHGNCQCSNVLLRPFVSDRPTIRVTEESKVINAKDQKAVTFVLSNMCINNAHIQVRRMSWEQWHVMQKELLDYHEALEKTEKSKAQWTRDELEDLEEPMMNPEILHKTLEAAMIGIQPDTKASDLLDPELTSRRDELRARKALQHTQVLEDDYENEDQDNQVNTMEDFEPDDGIFRGPSRRDGAPAAIESGTDDEDDDDDDNDAEKQDEKKEAAPPNKFLPQFLQKKINNNG